VLELWYSVWERMWVLCISKDLAFAENQWALIYNGDAHFSVYLSLVSSFCSTNSTASPDPPMSYVSVYQPYPCCSLRSVRLLCLLLYEMGGRIYIQGERVGEVIFSSSGTIAG
jgi:hypothetical protein